MHHVYLDFVGGVNMRGDQKWPPASNKEAMQAENEARISLAKGPACRPRKVTSQPNTLQYQLYHYFIIYLIIARF